MRSAFDIKDAQLVIDAILAYQREHDGVAPTVRELAASCLMSPTVMQYRLDLLEARGFIKRKPRNMRTIRVLTNEERDRL